MFIVFTIIFLLSYGAFINTFFSMIAPNGMLDIVFKWQRMLDYLYGKEQVGYQLLGKALGNCERCTSFWLAPVWIVIYYVTVRSVGYWPDWGIAVNIIWGWVFWVSAAVYGLWFHQKINS